MPTARWRIVQVLGDERRAYCVGTQEWRGSERRAKALADSMSVNGALFMAESCEHKKFVRNVGS
jgi:hypothetical protein